MTIPTTAMKFPLEGRPVDKDGNWTPTWHRAMQALFTRIGADVAPSNKQLASAIALNVVGSGTSVDGDVAVYSGTTGLLIHDTGIAAASLVAGPASAINSDIALFDGTTGKLIKDSGVQLSSLAPLASPALTGTPTAPTAAAATNTTQIATTAFVEGEISPLAPIASPALTGTPTAPTATAGTNTTQLATTAFVTTAVAAAGLTSASFSAHNNGVAQSIPNVTFTKLTFSTKAYDVGSKFATSTWTPPANRVVQMTGAVFFGASVAGTVITVSVYKNGVEYKRGSSLVSGGTAATSVSVACQDIPNGTDTYELWVYQSTGAAQNTNGAASLTYFQGTSIQA
jgi:hypothetical protein